MAANKKPELPKALTTEIDDLLGRSGDADRAGNGALSMQLVEEAWSLIPEPKTEWNFYPQTIARATVETIPEIGQCQFLDLWIERMYQTYFDPDRAHTFTNMVAGHALFQCGRQPEAVAAFKRVLQAGGPGFFTGPYRPYLDLAEKG